MKDFMHADRDGVLQATAGSYTVRRTAFSLAFRCPLPLPFTVFPLPFLGLPPPLPLPFRVFFTSSHCPATAIRSSSASRRRRTLAWASRPPPSMRAELSSESSTRPPAQDRSSSSCTNVAQDTAGFESKNQQRGKQQRGGNDSRHSHTLMQTLKNPLSLHCCWLVEQVPCGSFLPSRVTKACLTRDQAGFGFPPSSRALGFSRLRRPKEHALPTQLSRTTSSGDTLVSSHNGAHRRTAGV